MTDEEVTVAEVVDEQHVCPECGEAFKRASGLATHRSSKHGVAGARQDRAASDAAPKRRKSVGRRDRREQQVKETIDEFVKFTNELRGRSSDEPDDLADLLRKDAAKIAYSLSWVAERLAPVGWFIDKTMGHGGVITIATGFSGLLRKGLHGWREMIAKRNEQSDIDALNDPLYADSREDGNTDGS